MSKAVLVGISRAKRDKAIEQLVYKIRQDRNNPTLPITTITLDLSVYCILINDIEYFGDSIGQVPSTSLFREIYDIKACDLQHRINYFKKKVHNRHLPIGYLVLANEAERQLNVIIERYSLTAEEAT